MSDVVQLVERFGRGLDRRGAPPVGVDFSVDGHLQHFGKDAVSLLLLQIRDSALWGSIT